MRVKIKRIFKGPAYTVGRLSLDGKYFCDTLEDRVRPAGEKVPGQTAVPAGRYRVALTKSPRFGRVLPLVLNVPGFSGVRIHAGNSAADTEGCILVGFNQVKGRLVASRATLARLLEKLTTAVAAAKAEPDAGADGCGPENGEWIRAGNSGEQPRAGNDSARPSTGNGGEIWLEIE